ncbi:hypothetical protein E2C01_079942 [Portunus trituberculatus]|uniref:Uncharacterized protein n=1 Tax=Portunus trituberculatus TaxID=210409 RepID=A0A5B7ISN3_PORTR|nr:hypothetical protein [Portunus trituberculatus]
MRLRFPSVTLRRR